MSEPTFIINTNFNHIKIDSWIDRKRLPDGNYSLTGMGRCTEYDAQTGAILSDKTEPIGVAGWAPYDFFNENRSFMQWLRGLVK